MQPETIFYRDTRILVKTIGFKDIVRFGVVCVSTRLEYPPNCCFHRWCTARSFTLAGSREERSLHPFATDLRSWWYRKSSLIICQGKILVPARQKTNWNVAGGKPILKIENCDEIKDLVSMHQSGDIAEDIGEILQNKNLANQFVWTLSWDTEKFVSTLWLRWMNFRPWSGREFENYFSKYVLNEVCVNFQKQDEKLK